MAGQRVTDQTIPERLFKYVGFTPRVLQQLCMGEVYYSDPGNFNDPLDCRPTVQTDLPIPDLQDVLAQLIVRPSIKTGLRIHEEAPLQGGNDCLQARNDVPGICASELSGFCNADFHQLTSLKNTSRMTNGNRAALRMAAASSAPAHPLMPSCKSVFSRKVGVLVKFCCMYATIWCRRAGEGPLTR